jgi:hypothetical protein
MPDAVLETPASHGKVVGILADAPVVRVAVFESADPV